MESSNMKAKTKKIAECGGLEARRTAKKGLIACYRDGKPVIAIWRHDWRGIKTATVRRMLETLCYSDGGYMGDLTEAGFGEEPFDTYMVDTWIDLRTGDDYYTAKWGKYID